MSGPMKHSSLCLFLGSNNLLLVNHRLLELTAITTFAFNVTAFVARMISLSLSACSLLFLSFICCILSLLFLLIIYPAMAKSNPLERVLLLLTELCCRVARVKSKIELLTKVKSCTFDCILLLLLPLKMTDFQLLSNILSLF